ncbi:TPA: hypothetical protein ACSTJZ_002316 [Serratia fonticola]
METQSKNASILTAAKVRFVNLPPIDAEALQRAIASLQKDEPTFYSDCSEHPTDF